MNKFLSLALALLAASSVAAAPLTPAEALSRASKDSRQKIGAKTFVEVPAYVVKSESKDPAAYIFNASGREGFMVVPADDVAYPVLGYSDSGEFDPNNIPDQMQWWLSEYARMIEWAAQNNFAPAKSPVTNESWQKINPLCATKWDQGAPYNNECPIDRRTSRRCVTGCVATSMSQVVKYFNYPTTGQGSISYYPTNVGKTITMDFSQTTFDWDNMLNIYEKGGYTDNQALAVATLMKACGYAVEMNYGSDASGAQGRDIAKALKTYFNYDGNCRAENRFMYSMSDWSSMVYNNLANIGPVIINGSDPGDAGHSFIVDGYDGNGYFHLNWGWGGMSDGYFTLDALNPDSMGIGGYGSGFNYTQNGIFGIQPPTGQPATPAIPNLVQSGNLQAAISGSRLSLTAADYNFYGYQGWFNYTENSILGKFGVKFEPVTGQGETTIIDATYGTATSVNVYPNGICSSSKKIISTLPSVANGKYKVTLMFRADGYEWQDILVPWGYNNYVYLDKSGSDWTISYPDWNRITIESASIDSDLYNGFNVLVKTKFVNNSDLELTQGVTPCLMSGSEFRFLGPNLLITLQPHETVVKDLIFVFSQMSGTSFVSPAEYTLRFINRDNSTNYGEFGTYTMYEGPKNTILNLNELSIEGASKESVEYANASRTAYIVTDPSDFTIDFNFSVRVGYFDKIMKISFYEVDPEKIANLIPVADHETLYSDFPFLNKDEVSENQVHVSFPEANRDRLYAIRAEYGGGGSWKNLGAAIYIKPYTSGVSEIISDSLSDTPVYFNMQGLRVDKPVKGQIVIRQIGDKTEKMVY
ncbi:MAG: C10 family peptidase [Muribaculaceae bacterium]|nr:C10 family peptidase [Muribaculaceae bacterium]